MPCRRALPIAALVAGVALLTSACSIPDPTAGGDGHDHGRHAPPSTRATQLDHERQMEAAPSDGGHTHTHAHMHDMAATGSSGTGALTVPPGTTRRLTWTFDKPGIVLYGCHVLGHWAAGMKGTIVVLSPDRPTQRY